MSARRALRLFADQDPLQPQTTTKHGSPAAQREQFLLADVLEGMEQAWQAHMAHGGKRQQKTKAGPPMTRKEKATLLALARTELFQHMTKYPDEHGHPAGWTPPSRPQAAVEHLLREVGAAHALPGHLPGNTNPDHQSPLFA